MYLTQIVFVARNVAEQGKQRGARPTLIQFFFRLGLLVKHYFVVDYAALVQIANIMHTGYKRSVFKPRNNIAVCIERIIGIFLTVRKKHPIERRSTCNRIGAGCRKADRIVFAVAVRIVFCKRGEHGFHFIQSARITHMQCIKPILPHKNKPVCRFILGNKRNTVEFSADSRPRINILVPMFYIGIGGKIVV